jgi:ribonuclease R
MYVRLPNTVEGLVSMKSLEDDYYEFDESNRMIAGRRTHRTFRLGEEIEVLVADASVEKGTVDFTIEQKPASRRPERGRRQDMRRGGARRGRKNGRKEYRR